jgi:hypothetical protein
MPFPIATNIVVSIRFRLHHCGPRNYGRSDDRNSRALSQH